MKISKRLLLATMVPLTILAFGAVLSFLILFQTQASIKAYISDIDSRQTIISQIYDELGYGKGIHAFKNYILRGAEKYQDSAAKGFNNAHRHIIEYLKLGKVSSIEKESLTALQQTIGQYIEKIEVAKRMNLLNRSIQQIDQAVKVDDSSAISAIQTLQNYLTKEKTSSLEKIQRALSFAFFSVTIIIIATVGSAYFISREISRKISDSINQLIKFSSDLASNIGDNKEVDNIRISQDELQLLADHMIRSKKSLNLTFNQLKKTNEELEQFSFISAHDLKTPLKNILSLSVLMSEFIEQNEFEPLSTFSLQIQSETKTMLEYVSDLLSFTRLGIEQIKVSSVPVLEVIRELEASFKSCGKEVDFIVSKIPEFISADRLKFQRLLQNLFENSIKYSKNKVSIKISGESLSQNQWLFSVEDNGNGIRSRDFEKIFLPFRRATSVGEGTGIGLALVKKIVEIHGGDITVESEEHVYTKFSFSIRKFNTFNINSEGDTDDRDQTQNTP